MNKYTKDVAVELLKRKQSELSDSGEYRFPKRSDFSDEEVVAIKAFLGPWPRALEEADLKEKRSQDRVQRNREKRLKAKINRVESRRKKENK